MTYLTESGTRWVAGKLRPELRAVEMVPADEAALFDRITAALRVGLSVQVWMPGRGAVRILEVRQRRQKPGWVALIRHADGTADRVTLARICRWSSSPNGE